MDLKALNYFVSVYESGSFSAASKRCFIAQPSISASVQQLEQTLQQPLFQRFSRGVTATEAGHQLYPLAKQLLGQAGAIKDLFTSKPNKMPYRLGLIKGLSVEKMSNLLKQFTASVDGMDLTLVPSREHCDARIISQQQKSEDEAFHPIWQETYLLAIPANHPLRLSSVVTARQLENQAIIQRTPCEGWEQFRELLLNEGIDVDIRARIQTVEYALGLVRAGLGCAFIPVSEEVLNQQDIEFREIEGLPIKRNIGLAYKEESPITRTLKTLVDSN